MNDEQYKPILSDEESEAVFYFLRIEEAKLFEQTVVKMNTRNRYVESVIAEDALDPLAVYEAVAKVTLTAAVIHGQSDWRRLELNTIYNMVTWGILKSEEKEE